MRIAGSTSPAGKGRYLERRWRGYDPRASLSFERRRISAAAGRFLLKVIGMNARRLYPVMLLLAIGCQQAGMGADILASPADDTGTPAETDLNRQLKINRDALLKGSSEQIRIDAATVMLFSESPLARKVLLDALKQSENSAARVAICKALSQTRTIQEPIKRKADFIQPLLDVLSTEEDFDRAKLAAEAMLIFEYEQLAKQLEEIVSDTSLPAKARLNVIYALKLQPDMSAIFQLMKLLDDPDTEVSAGVEKALQSLGMPIGKDAITRRQIINEIKLKGREAFLRDWVVRQEARIRDLEEESDFWQRQYLGALGEIYYGLEDDPKGKFLAERLSDADPIVRLWALAKVSEWRKSTKPNLPIDLLGPILVSLISDGNRDVRLETAKLLSLMGELNSAQQLLSQLKVEQDDEVRMELFVALGGACYYAFIPNSPIKIPREIRRETLEWAAEYLSAQEAEKAQKGAEVMRKLLEQDGLASTEVSKYLGLLSNRYDQEKGNTDGTLRGELLRAMAGLCTQSVYKLESARFFEPLFKEALNDETDAVREAAVDGLIYIDNTAALKTLRKSLVDYSSIRIRERLISLAGEVGGKEDLGWLSERISSSATSDPAWQVMLKIFKRSEIEVLAEWIDKSNSPTPNEGTLSDEQKLSLLEAAEPKATDRENLLKDIREKLAQLYTKRGEFEQAAKYLGLLRQGAEAEKENEAILADLVNVYLRWPKVELATRLVANCLLEKDLEPENVIVRSIDRFLAEQAGGADPEAVLQAFGENTPQNRPKWRQQLRTWSEHFGQGRSSEPKEATDQP